MKFIKKYSLAIIIALGFLLICKSCQSCSRARQLEYEEIKYEQRIDSLENIIREDKDSIRGYQIRLDASNELNQTIKDQNNRLIKSNDNLTNTINNINNSK